MGDLVVDPSTERVVARSQVGGLVVVLTHSEGGSKVTWVA